MPARIPMTGRQRTALLALPDTEAMVVRYHSLDASDLDAIGTARTPATRLGYALQLCCLRYPGRHPRPSELLPAIMLDHIAEQVGVEASVIAGISVVERMAAEAMHRAETDLIAAIDRSFDVETRRRLDTLVDDKVHDRQSRMPWLREPTPRVAAASPGEMVEKVTRW